MITFPNAKINLGLYITSKRSDGYHNIESVFYPVPWCDTLEIIRSGNEEKVVLSESGIDTGSEPSQNLCIKAYHLLDSKYNLGAVNIHLHKSIPIGAGLGGGSADAAFCIRMLNSLFSLNLSIQDMENLAGELGSDCPFFIQNKPMVVTGRGEMMKPIDLDLEGYHFILVNPGIHIGTREAYAHVDIKPINYPVSEMVSAPIEDWKNHLHNAFEDSIFQLYPEINQVKDSLYKMGAIYASMSGSGSTVYGIFRKDEALTALGAFDQYLTWTNRE